MDEQKKMFTNKSVTLFLAQSQFLLIDSLRDHENFLLASMIFRKKYSSSG